MTPDVFTVALIKGAVEGDVTAHFGSLGGFNAHVQLAQDLGLLNEAERPTALSRELYHRHHLADLPAGRAYLAWTAWSATVDGLTAELRESS
jgi:hypothetical protein